MLIVDAQDTDEACSYFAIKKPRNRLRQKVLPRILSES